MNSTSKLLPALLVLVLFLAGFPLFALLAIVSMGARPRRHASPPTSPRPPRRPVVDGEVVGLLMQLRLAPGYPRITTEQAGNAVTIARVSRELGVPRRGLEVALATAIQESKLLDLDHGDRDSLGLFQQRPSQGWGTPAQITDPVLATRAFYGRADHTSNTGLLDIDGWHTLPLAEAAQAVQRSAHPSAYARWEQAARDMADLLGPDLPTRPSTATLRRRQRRRLCRPGTGDVGQLQHPRRRPHRREARQRTGWQGEPRDARLGRPPPQSDEPARVRGRHHRRPPGGPPAPVQGARDDVRRPVGHVPARPAAEQGHLGPRRLDDDRLPARRHPLPLRPRDPDAAGPADLHDHRPGDLGVEHPQPHRRQERTVSRRCAASTPPSPTSPRPGRRW